MNITSFWYLNLDRPGRFGGIIQIRRNKNLTILLINKNKQ